MSDIQNLIHEIIRGEMRKDGSSLNTTDMIQNIIYFFNQEEIRNHMIDHYQKLLPHGKYVDWYGTYYFDENGMIDPYYHPEFPDTSLDDFIKKKFKKRIKKHFIVFTCCILYEGNRVHYLSFIYKPSSKVLVAFDPGINLYTKGQDVLIPYIRKSFVNAGLIPDKKKSLERIGLCNEKYYNKKWGIQYDGSDPKISSLPADSFCQSWTMFFLIEFLRNKCTDRFFSSWCRIPPKYRESFILSHYFLPWLQHDPSIHQKFKQFYPRGDINMILSHITQQYPPIEY